MDHETKSSYEVVVQVTDSEDADGNFEIPAVVDDTITVTITVNDLEEPGKSSLSWTRPQPHTHSEVEATLTDPDGSVSGLDMAVAEISRQRLVPHQRGHIRDLHPGRRRCQQAHAGGRDLHRPSWVQQDGRTVGDRVCKASAFYQFRAGFPGE